ncbi:major facilitator superfamily domain-containing protein [Fennellomyces sp. T-0311]|nr:major facilitator superfamily domain-containing protein [Fennellomyces sp. T-0311]
MVPIGFGMALMQSCANVVCGEMPRGTMILNFLHACYGLGALIAPLLAAAILDRQMLWAITYMALCGMQWGNVITTVITFRNLKTRAEREQELEQLSDGDRVPTGNYDSSKILANVVRNRIAYIGALFLLLYVGVEVTIGGYGYTFLITVRSTDKVAMAHLISGYWGGICAGRLFLGYMTMRFGEKPTTYCYLAVIVGMLFIFWFVPIIGASAAALAITGVALGPLYPTVVSLANKVVPPRFYAVTIGLLSAFGSGGSALFPYLTGVMIGIKGVQVLMPFCVAIAIAMLVTWVFIPNPARHKRAKQESDGGEVARTSPTITVTISTRYRGGRNT